MLDPCLLKLTHDLETQLIESAPDSIQLLLMRSKSLGKRGKAHEAMEDVKKALERKKNFQVSS